MLKKLTAVILSFSLFTSFLFGAETKNPEPYNKEEMPQTLQDLRRFEIITLGAMPFVMLDTTLGYSIYHTVKKDLNDEEKKIVFKPTPFVGSLKFADDDTKKKAQEKIFFISLGVSLGIGAADLAYRHIKRGFVNWREERRSTQDISIEILEDSTIKDFDEELESEVLENTADAQETNETDSFDEVMEADE